MRTEFEKENLVQVGRRINYQRLTKRVQQGELCLDLGRTKVWLCTVEGGHISPKVNDLLNIAMLLDIQPSLLFEGESISEDDIKDLKRQTLKHWRDREAEIRKKNRQIQFLTKIQNVSTSKIDSQKLKSTLGSRKTNQGDLNGHEISQNAKQ